MLLASLCVALASGFSAESGTALRATRAEHMLALNEVYLNSAGPFRMLVDTGNASSVIRPEVARRLNLRPTYAVEHVTATGNQKVPVAILNEVRAGDVVDHQIEVMIADVRLAAFDGILGQSWLLSHDYLIDYPGSRLVMDGPAPAGGLRTSLRSADGRPAIVAEVDGRPMDLVLDSGTPLLVLFEPTMVVRPAMLFTNSGAAVTQSSTARVSLGPNDRRRMNAVRLNARETTTGLLPLNAFRAVYVSNRHGVAILVR